MPPPDSLDADGIAAQLGPAYEALDAAERARHPALAERIAAATDIAGESRPLGGGAHAVTVVAPDIPGALSLIAGSLTAQGFDIETADLFTLRRGGAAASRRPPPRPGRHGAGGGRPGMSRRPLPPRGPSRPPRLLLDRFVVRATGAPDPAAPDPGATDPWEAIRPGLAEAFALLAGGDAEAAHASIIEGIGRTLPRGQAPARPMYPIAIEVDATSDPAATVLTIAGVDERGFLFEFTNALAMLEVSIQRAEVRTEGSESRDTFWVTTRDGSKLEDPMRLDELRVVAVLIRQFTQLLPLAPDPAQALRQFSALARSMLAFGERRESLAALADEGVLGTLATALGVSRYLWEDFLRFQHENLFPVLTDLPALDEAQPAADLREALRAASPDGGPPDVVALNASKDRELFRIDLRHISGRTGFAEFSRELSDLAEVVVGEAAAITERTLEQRHGAPRLASGGPCRWTIAALGKFGGREIGFASDLELLTVYEGSGTSDGDEPIPNAAWFEQFVRGVRDAIQAPREGIFELDLRLRPHGDGGSLANSIDQCRAYYSEGGGARQFERMALVRLRPVAGDAGLGRALEELRDAFVYSGAPFDIAEQLHLRERQATELVAAGERNAKHSRGGLVDVEYYVQVLQIIAGATEPSVRTPSTVDAIAALAETGHIGYDDAAKLPEAYAFLRRLIGALRVVRGNARDLTIPPVGSREFEYLSRRLYYETPEALAAAIDVRMEYAASLWTQLPVE
ncbi:MAG: hypothetical protein F4Z25_09765 [Chloroflexi bacterium]|nr:hypothetical protein [Chloroflexota bacterium]